MDEKFITRSFRKAFKDDPELQGKILSVFDKNLCTIKAPDCDPIRIFPYFCQIWEGRGEPSIEEDLMCAQMWQLVAKDVLKYHIQETPRCFQDREINQNRDLVRSYITQCPGAGIIDADFWGGTHGKDGFIEFKSPPIHRYKEFPLEIGYIKPHQFFRHIWNGGCVARLPYNSNYIVYFENIEEGMFSEKRS